jgi:threonine dehydratase
MIGKDICVFYNCILYPFFCQEQKKIGVIAASAGNHALALCYHGADLGIPVTVVFPLWNTCD